MHADESERGADVRGADLLLDEVQGAQGDLLRFVELGAGGGAQAHLQLAVVGGREDFPAEFRTEGREEGRGEGDAAEDDEGLAGERDVEQGRVAGLDLGEETRGVRAILLE